MSLPLFARGTVVNGFGRGSRQLGIPTANLPDCVVSALPKDLKCGIYFGWASVRQKPVVDPTVFMAVASVGWNPFYKNTKRSLEVHVMHCFGDDFYGAELRVCLAGYIREEKNFTSIDELISAIKGDIQCSENQLKQPVYQKLASHDFFSDEKLQSFLFFDNGNGGMKPAKTVSNDSNESSQLLVHGENCGCTRD